MSAKRYLGDGVYVDLEYGQIVLTTSDGLTDTNRIVLEPEVVQAFDQWLAEQRAAASRRRDG